MILRCWLVIFCSICVAICDIMETSGFHCKNANSMRLERRLHGLPHVTIPPFEFSVLDDDNSLVEYYEPGVIYRIRLVGYIHFRGFMLQSRLCTPEGYLIGSLRGGRFILGDYGEIFGIRFQECDDSQANDTLTHTDTKKKFLIEAQWTADKDIGAVQFLLTVAAEDVLYWERWRPRNGFIRPKSLRNIKVEESLFKIEVPPGPGEPTLTPEELASTVPPDELSTSEPFDPKLFEEIEAAEESESNRLKSAESLIALNSAVTTIIFSPSSTSTASLTSANASKASKPPNGAMPSRTKSTSSSTSTSTTKRALKTATVPPANQNTTAEESVKDSSLLEDILAPNSTTAELSSFSQRVYTTPRSDEANITEVSRRLFKKYSPSAQDHLREDDLRFLNSHTQLLQHDFVDSAIDPEEVCRQTNPCENGGTCMVVDKKVQCKCSKEYSGQHCEEFNLCLNNACANNSTCRSGPRGTYICDCQKNTVGTYCQFTCEPDQCSGNGECIMRQDGKVGCSCNAGMTGRRCEKEINECQLAKCENSLRCIDKFNDYECVCMDGWMGKNCNRPCQDIYGSCKIWKREGECEIPPEETAFFQLNCPVSCEQCVPRNETMAQFDRLPAVLLPLSWLLGEWQAVIEGFKNRAFDYPVDFNSTGYNETLIFSVAKPLMFGTPSINYTCKAVSHDNPTDVHEHTGFLTIRQYPPPGDKTTKVALSSVNNLGSTLIEEGPLSLTESTSGPILNLAPIYVKKHEGALNLTLKRCSRSFVRKGLHLIQSVSKEMDGRKIKFKKIYKRVREFEFL